ncbi:uncharacterized protein LOC143145075 isoform X3 [Ptiloglossa arizonensis]|uniref:uncharacterized protein LOC143145075 isoform X3 n=1 Tax=Ptiloglossa arizonensis TaxID=3350558 RepID=UPI003F9EDF95
MVAAESNHPSRKYFTQVHQIDYPRFRSVIPEKQPNTLMVHEDCRHTLKFSSVSCQMHKHQATFLTPARHTTEIRDPTYAESTGIPPKVVQE